ncbi:MAG: hypothetical protein J6A75_01720 [Lachnospiraceae bacterium]|nr:hypothetical protein [Lachnospiraceae bacterium]
MRNKSKLTKIKKNKAPQTQIPKDWLYMCQMELELGKIKEALEADYSIEFWEEAGVLEVELQAKESASVDFETVDMKRADEVTAEYMKTNAVKRVFLVSIRPEAYEEAKKVMEKVVLVHGGFFCGDTEDFLPMIK